MQGRSIGSKRFNVGEAAPQPTRASIYQEENTPLEWMAAHDLRAQLAVPQRRAELHPRALRHGLIASQLGLPMLARAEEKAATEEWEQPEAEGPWPEQPHAAYSGETEYAGLDWSNTEQTTRYDEWELQKELVTYEDTYPGYDAAYDEHPRLNFQLPPVAAGCEPEQDQRHELDYAQAAYAPSEYAEDDQEHASSPGSYPYAQMARHSAQPSAARWHSEQPIRRIPVDNSADARARAHAAPRPSTASQTRTGARVTTHRAPATPAAEPRTATQSSFASAAATGQARTAHSLGTAHHGAANSTQPRTAPRASFAAHSAGAPHAYASKPYASPHAGVAAHAAQPHTRFAPHATQPHASTHAGIAPRTTQSHAPTQAGFAPRSTQSHASQHHAPTRAGVAAHSVHAAQPHTTTQAHAPTHAGFAARQMQAATAATGQRQVVRSFDGAASAGARAGASKPVRRYADDEPVVYPHGRSWLKRLLLLVALAGAGYAGHHYYFDDVKRMLDPIPASVPPPPAAAVAPPAQPAPPAAAVELIEATAPSPTQASQASPETAKERRSAARAALFAERWRERHAARRGRDDDSADDDREPSSARTRSYARANDAREDYTNRSSASAHDDYVNDRHAAAQSGTLRINSLPWSQVHIDGQLVGHTPQMNLLLPAGKHRVTLVNNEMQLSKSLTVQITPGNITTHTVNLAE